MCVGITDEDIDANKCAEGGNGAFFICCAELLENRVQVSLAILGGWERGYIPGNSGSAHTKASKNHEVALAIRGCHPLSDIKYSKPRILSRKITRPV